MAQWKWDRQHALLAVAFALGVVWSVANWFSGKTVNAETLLAFLPVALLAINNVLAFLKSPPSDPASALAQGESVAANTNAAKRGFSSLRIVGGLAVAGILAALIFTPSARRTQTTMQAQGCAWWQGNNKTVTVDAAQVASCVLGQLFAGAGDPVVIAAACAPATLGDVVAIVESLLQFYSQPTASDAGVAAVAAPTWNGVVLRVPSRVDDVTLARMRSMVAGR